MARSRLPMILIAGGSVLAVIVLALILMSMSGESATTAEVATVAHIKPSEPAPTAEATPEAPRRGSNRGAVVFGTSVRDPFMPQVTPSASQGDSTDSGTSKSSNPQSPRTSKSTQKDAGAKPKASGGSSKGSKTTKSKDDTAQESGPKAPQPIGGPKTKGDTPAQQIDVAVLQVQDSLAVVRINGTRATLYLNVPDPTGVTYVSSLGGGCGWFGTGDLTERYTICEGDSRPVS